MTLKSKAKYLKELYYEPLDSARKFMIIEDMVPVGLTLIAGLPKIGKSWMILQLGMAIAKGEPFLGKQTEKCEVLYYCLDDAERRLQIRVAGKGVEPNDNFMYCTDAKTLGTGFLGDLKTELEAHPNIRVVIIDTLQKIRDFEGGTSNGNMYSKDDKELTALKKLAYKKDIAVVAVHHTTKNEDDEHPLRNIQGSSGVTGAADSILKLQRNIEQTDGTLLVVSRDAPEYKMNLRFKDTEWSLLSIESQEEIFENSVPDVVKRIAEFIRGKETWKGTMSELCNEIGETEMKPNKVSGLITKFYGSYLVPNGVTFETLRKSENRLRLWKFTPPREESKEPVTDIPSKIATTEEATLAEDDNRSVSQGVDEETENHMINDEEWKENIRKAISILGRPQAS